MAIQSITCTLYARVLSANGWSKNHVAVQYVTLGQMIAGHCVKTPDENKAGPPSDQSRYDSSDYRLCDSADQTESTLPDGFDYIYTLSKLGSSGSNRSGDTALHFVAAHGTVENAEDLLSKGACLESKNERGDTPLFWAVAVQNTNVLKFLIDKGALTQATNKDGITPRKLASLLGYSLPLGYYCMAANEPKANINHALLAINPSVKQLEIAIAEFAPPWDLLVW
eukprot:CAMPEP_0168523116 /NCGR_PEP_ID=MMETSP0405-20121227/9773_1 /TAXON_ID=498012 /ORGANISM="Trichosphaerium sp, Strain Am-I-7 wt" /LENGTH=224 /DNA_ID=CAMNT_0008544891 /DNA_START=707 /DNA_END=1378 /DNA_ORIENTATION=-